MGLKLAFEIMGRSGVFSAGRTPVTSPGRVRVFEEQRNATVGKPSKKTGSLSYEPFQGGAAADTFEAGNEDQLKRAGGDPLIGRGGDDTIQGEDGILLPDRQ